MRGNWIHDTQIPDCETELESDILSDCTSQPCPIDHNAQRTYYVGKKAAGALLDGREWKEFPKSRGGEKV